MTEIDLKVGSFKGHADLDIDPKEMFMSFAEKLDSQRLHKTLDFLKQYKKETTVGAGILGLLSGKNIDLPPVERGDHTFGIRDINLDILKDYPELFYTYGTEEGPFNLEATAGGDQRDKYMTVGGKFTFADGGIIGNSDMGMPWNPNFQVRDAAWIEGRDWHRGANGEQIPILRGPPPDQPIHKENMMPEDGGALPGGGGFDERAGAIAISDNRIPQKNTGMRANTRSPAPIAITPRQPMTQGPTSSNPENPYVASVANHPLVNPPTIPTMGGGLSSLGAGHGNTLVQNDYDWDVADQVRRRLDRVGWGAY
tara:strand:- start:2522 stop:3454 length:933 start_codon:yes stop_codon:yes gene_type:complete